MKNEILKLRKDGLTYDEIVKKVGCSKSNVSYHCRQNEISRYDNSVNLPEDIIKEMQSYYDDGNSTRNVSKKFNMNRYQVSKYIRVRSPKSNQTIDERKKSVVKNVIYWRQKAKLKLVDYKGGKCQVETCGYHKSVRSLQFHHIDSTKKDFTISGKTVSLERMKKEVDKCILVCNNCHGEIHEELDQKGYSDIVNKILNK